EAAGKEDDDEGGEGGESENEDLQSDSDSDGSRPEETQTGQPHHSPQDVKMVDMGTPPAPSTHDPEEQLEEPTFGELIRNNDTEPIDVEAAFGESHPQSLIPSDGVKRLQHPSATSLGTVLSQSLKTNDTNLLESCLHTTDLGTIRSTIERLDSPLAAVLLQRLAERLHRRPGRAGSLMVWVQWTLVSHGGYLAAQPGLMQKLGSLNRVIRDRANGLQPLLSLKGKLDMLEAQMQLRRSLQASARTANPGLRDLENDEEGVLYVEGQAESDSEDGTDPRLPIVTNGLAGVKRSREIMADLASESDDGGTDMPTTVNGADHESDDHDGSSDDEYGMIDDEAEETGDDTDAVSENEVDYEDVDSVEEDDEIDDAGPPAKRASVVQRSSGLLSRRK
ncbi:MAG: Small subunit (SSU) processome component, partial [Candelina submexicana]